MLPISLANCAQVVKNLIERAAFYWSEGPRKKQDDISAVIHHFKNYDSALVAKEELVEEEESRAKAARPNPATPQPRLFPHL